MKRRRSGIAAVEFAVCLPALMLVIFGFITCGLMVQLKTNSKAIGHLAATELFQAERADHATQAAIRSKYEGVAAELGISGFSLQIQPEPGGAFAVRSSVALSQNSYAAPIALLTDTVATETFVLPRNN